MRQLNSGSIRSPSFRGCFPPSLSTGVLLAVAASDNARRLDSKPRRGLAAAAPAPAGGCAVPAGGDAQWIDPDTPGNLCSIQRCTPDYETCTGAAPPSTTMQARAVQGRYSPECMYG